MPFSVEARQGIGGSADTSVSACCLSVSRRAPALSESAYGLAWQESARHICTASKRVMQELAKTSPTDAC